jgi:hypothetical protein
MLFDQLTFNYEFFEADFSQVTTDEKKSQSCILMCTIFFYSH